MKWTISKAVLEWNINPKTLKIGLVGQGHEISRGATWTTLQICAAIYGDLDRERTLETIERRKLLEKENAERDGLLVPMAQAEELYTRALLPVRQRLLALPSEAASRCNPTDPQFARDALQRWLDDALPLIRERLPKA